VAAARIELRVMENDKISDSEPIIFSHCMTKDDITMAGQKQPAQDGPARLSDQRLPTTFAALRHRNFRLFWSGQLVSLIGTWMQNVAQGWLVLTLTNSAFMLGVVSAIGSLPVLFLALPGGVAADRFPKRNLLLITQSLAMLLALILALLTRLQIVKIWQVVAIAALAGSAFAFDAPSRQALVIELVGRQDLLNAIALNSAIFNAARIIGPALAGMLISIIGMAGCFFLNSLSFLAVIVGLWLIRLPGHEAKTSGPVLRDMKEGLVLAWNDVRVRSLIAIIAIFSICGMPYAMLMPVFARDVLNVGARGLGFLMTANGVGALTGALGLASLKWKRGRARLVLISGIAFALALASFSLSRTFWLSLAILPLVGWSMVSQTATINTILQSVVPDNMRGRVMSLYTLVFMGMMPFGSFLGGALAQRWGAPGAVRIGAAVCLVSTLAIFWRRRELMDV